MRYGTCADWIPGRRSDELDIEVGTIGVPNEYYYQVIVSIHELIEYILLQKKFGMALPGVDKMVTEWDEAHSDDPNPGANPAAPYHKEHMIAEDIEYRLIEELDLSEKDYDAATTKQFEVALEAAQRRGETGS